MKQLFFIDCRTVDKCFVGACKIGYKQLAVAKFKTAVRSRKKKIFNCNITVAGTSEIHGLLVYWIFLAGERAGRDFECVGFYTHKLKEAAE